MNKKFTKLMAALALLTCLTVPMGMWGQATTYTSNVTLPQSGTNVSSCKVVINNTEYNAVKLGKSGSGASTTISIPSGTTTLYVHCAAWNGKSSTLTLSTSASGVSISPSTAWSLTSDSGISGSSTTFTLANPNNASTSYFKEYTLSGVNNQISVTITASSERAVFWGVNTSAAVASPAITTDAANNSLAVPNQTLGSWDEAGFATLMVNGTNLTAGISLNLGNNSPFEMSADLTNWLSSVTIPQANGSITEEQVAFRLKESLTTVQAYSDNVTLSSTGADNVTVALTGSVTNQTYTLTDESGVNGSISFSALAAEAGAHVTLTATPANDAYYFVPDSWSFFKDDLTDVTEDIEFVTGETNVIVMPAYNLRVDASFQLKPTYAVTCVASPVAGGEIEASPTSAYEGQTVTLSYVPETGYILSSIVITKTSDGTATGITPTASGDDYTFTMPAYAVTATATFISSTFEGTFEQFTGTIVEGDYLLVYNNKAMNNDNTTTSNKLYYTNVTPNNNNVTNPDRAMVWHIAASSTSDYWTIYNAASNKYVSGASSGTNLTLVSDTDDNSIWKVSGTYDFRCKANEGQSTDRFIRYYTTNNVFGNYASSNGGPLTLYKLKPSVAPVWSAEFQTTSNILTDATYELTVSDYVSGEPTPTITLATEVSSSLYVFEDGEFMFSTSTAGTYEFTFTATNSAGSNSVTLTITVSAPVQVNYYYSENGVLDSGTPITQGQSATLDPGTNLNSEFVFVGWTTNPSDVDNILAAGSSQTINAATTFYAVYAKTVSTTESRVVVLDGSADDLTGTAQELTFSENGFTYHSSSVKYQLLGSNHQNNVSTGKALLIGKKGAYLYNTTAFGNGITKFEIYANAGAAAAATAGVFFSTSTIAAYETGDNTWESDSDGMGTDNLFDASDFIPSGAKYFWYQVTNDKNTQVQFRITYTATASTTTKYTRVFLDETASAAIAINGPSIIPSGKYLNMGSNTLTNATAANLIIEDGGQLVTSSSNVQATVQKNIAAHGATAQDGGWNFIATPIVNGTTPSTTNGILSSTENDYDLFFYDEPTHYWRNYKNNDGNTSHGFNLRNGQGYLYANAADTQIEFTGTLRPSNVAYTNTLIYNSNVGNLAGWNLVGNPFPCNATVSMSGYIISQGAIVAATGTVAAPCSGVMVKATATGQQVTFTPTTNAASFSTGHNQLNVTIANNMTARGEGSMIDNAIVSFNENSQLEKFVFFEDNAKLYIPQGEKDYAIVSAEAQGEMPVCFKATKNGEYTITVSPEGVELNYLHLIDNMTGMDVDLLQTPSYTFEASTRDYESRFKLVFAGASTDSATDESFAYYDGSEWKVSNEGEATLQVVDVIGRIVKSETINGNFNLNLNQKAGVYMLRLVNGENVKVQKVVVR